MNPPARSPATRTFVKGDVQEVAAVSATDLDNLFHNDLLPRSAILLQKRSGRAWPTSSLPRPSEAGSTSSAQTIRLRNGPWLRLTLHTAPQFPQANCPSRRSKLFWRRQMGHARAGRPVASTADHLVFGSDEIRSSTRSAEKASSDASNGFVRFFLRGELLGSNCAYGQGFPRGLSSLLYHPKAVATAASKGQIAPFMAYS